MSVKTHNEEYYFKKYLENHQESMNKISNGIEASGRAIENVGKCLGEHDVKVEAQHAAQAENMKFTQKVVVVIIMILAAALGFRETLKVI
jgi:uracil phosphoribosyltransferase